MVRLVAVVLAFVAVVAGGSLSMAQYCPGGVCYTGPPQTYGYYGGPQFYQPQSYSYGGYYGSQQTFPQYGVGYQPYGFNLAGSPFGYGAGPQFQLNVNSYGRQPFFRPGNGCNGYSY